MSAIAANCNVPVSVKCRIGVDDRDSYEELCELSSETSHVPLNFLRLPRYEPWKSCQISTLYQMHFYTEKDQSTMGCGML
jgi:hypothetical protein